MATHYGLDEPRGRGLSPFRVRNFNFTLARPTLGSTQPPIQWLPGALFSGVKREEREADHSPPTCAKIKATWTYKSTPPYAFME
jgi:hypothetical protein